MPSESNPPSTTGRVADVQEARPSVSLVTSPHATQPQVSQDAHDHASIDGAAALASWLQAARNHPGRPGIPARTPEALGIIIQALQDGCTESEAARRAGIDRTALWRWCQQEPSLEAAVQHAKRVHGADWYADANRRIIESHPGDPRTVGAVAIGLKLRGYLQDRAPQVLIVQGEGAASRWAKSRDQVIDAQVTRDGGRE